MTAISLVIPSYNKSAFLDAALRSVLGQGFTDLQIGVVDGNSSDGSLEILERYRDALDFLIVEPDAGMYDALAKGFARTTGEIMGYLGADDLHMPWTLSVVSEIFERFPDVQWITSAFPLTADANGRVLKARTLLPPTGKQFWRGENLPGFSWWSAGWIQQESTFWRRYLWESAGGLSAELKLAGDFDLWCRFMKLSDPTTVALPLAAFRRHGSQITENSMHAYRLEAMSSFRRQGGRPGGSLFSRGRELARRCGLGDERSALSYNFSSASWQFTRFPY